MGKKTKAQLVEEGKALGADIQMVRSKGPVNFALFLADEGVVAVFDKLKSPDALRGIAKKTEGATSKGAVGSAMMDGKIVVLTLAEGEEAPQKLGKEFKRHMKERGLAFKVLIKGSDGKVLEADEEEAPAAPAGPADETGVGTPGAPPNPDNGLKDKLEKAFEKMRSPLVDALKNAPVDYQGKLKTAAGLYATAMKGEDYEAAFKALTALRPLILKAPTKERLTAALTDKGDSKKLSEMKDLLDGIVTRAKTDNAFDKDAKPLMKEARGALKAALGKTPAPTGEELKALQEMKKQLDDTFLEYLKKEGHGPQRHEGGVTKKQLEDRCTQGLDPMTGTTTDGGHGGTHAYGKDATRFKDPGDYVDAEEYARALPGLATKKQEAITANTGRFEIKVPLKDALGTDYKSKLEGKTRTGSKNHPTGSTDTDFTDGNLVVRYKIKTDGSLELITMFPEPKP